MKALDASSPSVRETNQSARPFGELLRIFRLKANFSQEGLAERAGVSVKAVASIEQGARRAPYRQTVALLAEALGVSPRERQTLDAAADGARSRKLRRPPSELPPPANNLPRPLTPFINRPEVDELAPLLERHRLVTITGSGGVGKTRTAIEVSQRRLQEARSPVSFVDLSSLRDGRLIIEQIAAALEISLSGTDEALVALVATLSSRKLCLVLDNCEHVIADVSHVVGALLRDCPSVSILITSRELLGLTNEVVYRLPSLKIPENAIESLEEAHRYSALALFIQRVHYADTRLALGVDQIPAIIDICRKLDGIPLAIELAAARMPTTGLDTLRARLNDAFILSGGRGLPPRQHTMEATISWSFRLLTEAEQTLLQRASIFAGGFTLEAAEVVCSGGVLSTEDVAGLLTRLVEKSLVNVVHVADKPRYTLLELIRAFSLERLKETTEYTDTARRHAEWLATKGDALREKLDEAIGLRFELDNASAAIAWCLGSRSQTDVALAARIVSGWRLVWGAADRYVELRRYVADVLEKLDDVEANYALIARLWRARVNTYNSSRNALILIQEATPFLERAGDAEGIAFMYAQLALAEARVGSFAQANESLSLATRYYEVEENQKKGEIYYFVSSTTAWVLCAQGKIEQARAELVASGRQMKRHGADVYRQAERLSMLAEIEFASGETALAIELCGKALNLMLDLHGRVVASRWFLVMFSNLSSYLLVNGDLAEAERCGKQALTRAPNRPFGQLDVAILLPVQHLAAIAAVGGRSRLAAALLGFIDTSYRRVGVSRLPETDKRSYDILVSSLHEQLSTDEIAKLRVEGEALDFEAVRELLEIASEEPGR